MENPRSWSKGTIAFFSKIFILVLISTLILQVNILAKDQSQKISNDLNTAIIFEKSFQYQKAIEVLQESKGPKDNFTLGYLAKLLYLTNQSKKANRILIKLDGKKWYQYVYLGLISEDLGQIKQAISAYRKSLNLNKNSIALFRLAKIYYKRKEYKKAIKLFKDLINYDSSIRLAYYYLGQSLKEVDENEKAYRYLAKAVNFYPEFNKAKKELKEVKEKLGRDFFLKRKRRKAEEREKITLASYQREKNIPLVRVGIVLGLDKFSFFSPGYFMIKGQEKIYQGKPNVFYTFKIKNNKVFLSDYKTDKVYAVFSSPVDMVSKPINESNYPFYVLDVIYGVKDFWHKKIDRAYRGDFKIVSKKNKINLINIVSIEEYLYGVLAAEIPPSVGREALKAQAVLARSLAIRNKARHSGQGFDFCADVHCQVYHGLSAETRSTREAVDDTRGESIFYQAKIPEIFYHSNCGGCLASDIFGQKKYLADGRDSKNKNMPESACNKEQWFLEHPQSFCSGENSKFRWQRIYDRQDFKIIFGTSIKNLENIIPQAKKGCFRYGEMDVVLSDELIHLRNDLRIRNFFDHLRSSAFSFEIKKDGKEKTKMLIFWGAGFGHGTGLCQEGAIGMAKEGYNYLKILKHYYPRAEINKAY